MIISLYPKPTKCYGDTVIRCAEKVDSITEKVDFSRYYLVISQKRCIFAPSYCIKSGTSAHQPAYFIDRWQRW
jgi:hypothetical protein